MGIVIKAPFNQARSEECSGEVSSITVEDNSVILSVKGETGIYCDYHLIQSHGKNVRVGDKIEFSILPVNFDNEDTADEDFCFPIELARTTKPVPQTECTVLSFPAATKAIPSDPSKGL